MIVSHDRYFLDRVCTEIWALDCGALARYDCASGRAYADYVAQKAERIAQAERDYAAFVDEDKRQRDVIAELRTHGSHNYSHVRSREKQLAKLDRVEPPVQTTSKIAVQLSATRRATKGYALRASGLTKAYDRPLFAKLAFDLVRGERLAVVGENGSGKSTLLGIVAGRIAADAGHVRVSEGVRVAYFSQDTADDLPSELSAVDAVLAAAPIVPERARSLLGRLGLGGEAADKRVGEFSGGERRRIMLARLMAQASDCLLLDEPTNDLDIPSREALEAVLAGYGGAMMVISHDRYLLARVAQRVLWLHDGTATLIDGGYDAYEARE
ncbi:MAG: ABC-F family ATP-binding cassette domain-containing protein, partial [Vulcanimicrobiaceae bacterium]